MQRQGKGMDLFHSGVTLVISSIEGLADLQECLSERTLASTLALHASNLRLLLPKYSGYEVGCPPLVILPAAVMCQYGECRK